MNRGKERSAVTILLEFTFFWDKRSPLIIDLEIKSTCIGSERPLFISIWFKIFWTRKRKISGKFLVLTWSLRLISSLFLKLYFIVISYLPDFPEPISLLFRKYSDCTLTVLLYVIMLQILNSIQTISWFVKSLPMVSTNSQFSMSNSALVQWTVCTSACGKPFPKIVPMAKLHSLLACAFIMST